ncbi:MAG: PqqD family protein [Desulfotomaculaceae bacterium]|nr:PqqD family protein [Desulfotomaculaceae bacterium]
MRIKEGYLLREVAGNHVVVPTGKASLDFSGMITLNGTGAFLWKQLAADKSEQELLMALLEEYDIDEAAARADIAEFLAKLKAAELFE